MERGVATGCRVLQIFVKNNSRWVGREIERREALEFRRVARGAGLAHVAAHTSYLINLASPSSQLRDLSITALVDEVLRCRRLGIRDLVLHPGSHGGEGEAAGIARIAASLEDVLRRTAGTGVRILLETAAGQGSSVGHRFEHLRDILGAVPRSRRLAVCLDTCHVHAAGYDLVFAGGLGRDDRGLRPHRRTRPAPRDPRQRLEEPAGSARRPPPAHRTRRDRGGRIPSSDDRPAPGESPEISRDAQGRIPRLGQAKPRDAAASGGATASSSPGGPRTHRKATALTRGAVSLAGSALLLAAAILRLPPPADLLRRVATPFDRTRAHGAGPAFVLLSSAAPLIPAGASVEVRSSDPAAAEYAYQLAVGMLPGRVVSGGRRQARVGGVAVRALARASRRARQGRVLLEPNRERS